MLKAYALGCLDAPSTGMVPSQVMETPAAASSSSSPATALAWSDVKRTYMLPDVATWIAGTAAPLNLPLSAPFADVPS